MERYGGEIDENELRSLGYIAAESVYLRINMLYIPGLIDEVMYQLEEGKKASAAFKKAGGVMIDYQSSIYMELGGRK